MERYFSLLLPNDDIQIIKYFTAKILGSHRANQESYIKALLTLNKVQITYGDYIPKTNYLMQHILLKQQI